MRKMIGFLLVLSFGLLSFTGCEKTDDKGEVFQVKLLASFCAFHIVEIQDSTYYKHGMDWTSGNGQVYRHVFAVKNHCDFAKANIRTDQLFTCRIVTKPQTDNCAVCAGFMETPPLMHNIQVVK